MPEAFRVPGTSIQTPKLLSKKIVGVPTSTAVLIGSFPKGPVYSAQQIRTLRDFEQKFGGFRNDALASSVVHQFFTNGGTDIWLISVGSKFLGKAGPFLKGLSLVSRVKSASLLLVPETFELADREVDQVYRHAVSVAVKQGLIYVLDLPRRSSSFRTTKDVTIWVKSRREIHRPNVAVYFPFVQIQSSSRNSKATTIPVSGTLAGIYARMDQSRGVWKAPAGTEASLRRIVGLKPVLSSNDNKILGSANINPLARLPIRGICCLGCEDALLRSGMEVRLRPENGNIFKTEYSARVEVGRL